MKCELLSKKRQLRNVIYEQRIVYCFIYLFIYFLFIQYFKRIAHLATLASLPYGPLDIFTYIQIHTI